MNNISYCTNVKGRLWQLEQTLPYNLTCLSAGDELVLLDYQSPDGLRDYIFSNFESELDSGALKYYYLDENYRYSCAYAKNVVHRLATKDVLFNLDADNYISHTSGDLKWLKANEIYIPRYNPTRLANEGILGRLGYHRDKFHLLNGYNETIVGMGGDDGDLISRSATIGMRPLRASHCIKAIQNTEEQKELYTQSATLTPVPIDYPRQYGVGRVLDRFNEPVS